jgi:serine/threonine protein kinase
VVLNRALERMFVIADDVGPIDDHTRAHDEPARECAACGWVGDSRVCDRCGQCSSVARVPRVIRGQFVVRSCIGRGASGVVYLAKDRTLDRWVAVKTLADVPATDRLIQEAQTMARVVHPNLATIYGVETWRSRCLLMVEYVGGGTLEDRLKAGPLEPTEVVEFALALFSALRAIHAAGVLHRDVKPSNIARAADGTWKLIDFGVAQMANSDDETYVGTPLYTSPEQLWGGPANVAADLWAAAVTSYEALCGVHPLADDRRATEVAEALCGAWSPDPDRLPEGCPDALVSLLVDALDADPGRRPSSAAEVIERLTSHRFATGYAA